MLAQDVGHVKHDRGTLEGPESVLVGSRYDPRRRGTYHGAAVFDPIGSLHGKGQRSALQLRHAGGGGLCHRI